MEISKTPINLQSAFSQNITPKPSFIFDTLPSDDTSTHPSLQALGNIQDVFSPSREYLQILEIKDKAKGGLKDTDTFMSMAQMLKDENIIDSDMMMAADFLASHSPKLSLDAFNQIAQTDRLSLEMRGLISELIQKLAVIDYASKGGIVA
ncbi:hypothetical protein BKH46_02315 [Helicobacter sp. 12S02634-8]|uniref:hypothetical protein n=1 Tax=Helicobacter sp. 12S02634-8 TaxID=1476199 RepID=UPI000BA66699|nr:hypothetical protein [Helicobacter sp. 12S02634-8]PAF48161.1 hypothetical protein BKH46_02315 [Helicobacter sp. 12S02634-8]